MMNIWHELRIDRTTDRRAIKRAYSARLKEVHPEDDPVGFQRLRDAYERAIASIHEPQRIQPMSKPNPPVIAPEPPPSKPKVPFRARGISHQRANRKAASPIIMMGEPNRKLPERNPQPPKRRPKLERFRREFLKNGWPQKRRRMVGMLLLPYDTDALDQEYGRLSRWEQLHWHEDFGTLIEELKAEYEASLDELGIDADTAEYWAREPEVSYSKDLWRGSAIISAAVTVVLMLVIAGARLSDEMAYGPHPWWIEAIWVFGVIVTANRTWLSRRRRLWGLACATLLVPPYTMIPELAAPSLLLAAVPLTAATSFPRATTYILMGMASGVYFVPIAWLGEAVHWVLRVPEQHDPDNELQAALLVWLVILSGFAGLVYNEVNAWKRILLIALWIFCTEAFMAYARSERVTGR